MPSFDSIKDLEKHINKKIASALKNEVAEKVKDEQQFAIDDEVYSGYNPSTPNGEPWEYSRRRDKGGLSDRKNMVADVKESSDGVELSVQNVTKGKDDKFMIADLIEYGDGYAGKEYTYKNNRDNTAYQYLRGRPFTKETEKELQQTKGHVNAMKKGLRRQGLDVD